MMLFVALIEIPVMLIVLLAVKAANALEQPAGAKHAKPKELSEEQKIHIINTILESSLLINDRVTDDLLNEGESMYPAAKACKLKDVQDFDLQYGTKHWMQAWTHALQAFFDSSAEYVSDGVFHVYGKEV